MEDMLENNVASPVFAVYYPDDIIKSPKNVYLTLKEAAKFANSPEGKSNSARFKRFGTPKEAMNFLAAGDCVSPISRPLIKTVDTPTDPVVPHSSVTKIQMNGLKKAIEKADFSQFNELIETNPRYLVNTGGDIAAIVMEAFRYNALHIAARHGNTSAASRILRLISDIKFLVNLYGTTEDDVRIRRDNIIDSYLNTPDKGACDTPLHIASKFGHVGVMRVLLAEKSIDKTIRNKEGLLASELICSRYNGENKKDVSHQMQLLLTGFYVALYRSEHNVNIPKLIVTPGYPHNDLIITPSPSTSFRDKEMTAFVHPYLLSACAGPFSSESEAKEFLKSWTSTETNIRRSDLDKGYERIGRELASNRVEWAESWCFLDGLIDLSSTEGLKRLDDYLRTARLRTTQFHDPVRKVLDFDDNEGENGEPNKTDDNDDDSEGFCDARDSFLNDSLSDLIDKLNTLTIHSPKAIENKENTPSSDQLLDKLDNLSFFTPPSTPPTVYLLDEPTKVDNDLMLALARIPTDQISQFTHVKLFIDGIHEKCQTERAHWPGKDSPRRNRPKSRLS